MNNCDIFSTRSSNFLRSEKKSNYTIIPNKIMDDQNLSIESRFCLSYMLSKPNTWTFYRSKMQEVLNVGRDKFNKILTNLAAYGYLKITKTRNERGYFDGGEVWNICDSGSLIVAKNKVNQKTDNQGSGAKPAPVNKPAPIQPPAEIKPSIVRIPEKQPLVIPDPDLNKTNKNIKTLKTSNESPNFENEKAVSAEKKYFPTKPEMETAFNQVASAGLLRHGLSAAKKLFMKICYSNFDSDNRTVAATTAELVTDIETRIAMNHVGITMKTLGRYFKDEVFADDVVPYTSYKRSAYVSQADRKEIELNKAFADMGISKLTVGVSDSGRSNGTSGLFGSKFERVINPSEPPLSLV